MKKIILASASKRRMDLLQRLKIPFEIIISDLNETMDEQSTPSSLVISLSKQKAYDVLSKVDGDAIIIAADTIVVFQGEKIGKPKNSGDATDILNLLRGQIHQVYSGVCILDKCGSDVNEETFFDVTNVKMRNYSQDEINTYVATGDPLDKAGSYGIQSFGMVLVERINGDYYNVEGLPVAKLFCCLKKFNIDVSAFWI